MRYFDSRDETLGIDHVLASGALPPAFPAVRIDGDPYWDGGIYSNTPIEAVLDDKPRQDSVIFTVNMWNPEGPEPESLWQVMGRHEGHPVCEPRDEPHRPAEADPPPAPHHPRAVEGAAREARNSTKAKELASWGCGTTMHVAPAGCPEARPRGSHEGHRLHARRHPRALAGGIRGYEAHGRARAVDRRRSDGRRRDPTIPAYDARAGAWSRRVRRPYAVSARRP